MLCRLSKASLVKKHLLILCPYAYCQSHYEEQSGRVGRAGTIRGGHVFKNRSCTGRDAIYHGAVSSFSLQGLQDFYLYGICCKYRYYFKELPSYGRFVSLMPRLFLSFCVLFHSLKGEQSGIYFVDSTKLAVCHNARITRHKVFEGMAKRGKSTMGWFYGFKLHIVINHKGETMAVRITPGNRDDAHLLKLWSRICKASCLVARAIFPKNYARNCNKKASSLSSEYAKI